MKAEEDMVDVKKEVKDEPLEDTVAVKSEVKAEELDSFSVKVEVKMEESGRCVKRESTEECQENGEDDVVIIDYASARQRFHRRLCDWIEQCVYFQRDKKTWAPAAPCCLPNCFLEPPSAPPPQLRACYHRLTDEQKKQFRRFIDSGLADSIESQNPFWQRLLHPGPLPSHEPERKGATKLKSSGCVRSWLRA